MPAFAPGISVHIVADQETLVLGQSEHWVLRGRGHARVASLIDGYTSDEEIVATLAPELPPAVVYLALQRLADRGVIVHVAPGPGPHPSALRPGPGAVIAEVDLAGPGEFRFIGIGVAASVTAQLTAAVAARQAHGQRGLMVAVVDDYLRSDLHQLAGRCRENDLALLPIRCSGQDWWFGPYCDGAGAGSMWQLLTRRLHANRRGAMTPLPDPDPHGPGAEVVEDAVPERDVAYAAGVIERTLRDGPPPSLSDGLLVRDQRDGRLTEHRVAVIAPSDVRTTPAFGERAHLPVAPARSAKGRATTAGHHVYPPDAALVRMTPLISPITGVVRGLERVPALEGAHVYATVGTLEWPDAAERDSRLPVFRGGALGKGLSDAQARASCMGEAIELVSASFVGDEPRRRARWSEVGEIAVHPERLLLVSDRQYEQAAGQPPIEAWDRLLARFDERHPIEWVPLVSLVSGETRWLPAAYCYFGYRDPEYPGAPYATAYANGCAVGNTLEEAILQGLLELIERDACAMWWYNRVRRPGIDLDSLGHPRLAAIRDAHAALGRELALLDLRTDTEVTVVGATAWDRESGIVQPTGHGCHLNPTVAIERAIAELAQVSAIASPADDPSAARATITDRPHLMPDSSSTVRVTDLPDLGRGAVGDEVEWCVHMLARLGHDPLVLDTTRPDLGFASVRVVVPGLRPLHRRLAPGRLYDVPVERGWLPHALREEELNPESFVS